MKIPVVAQIMSGARRLYDWMLAFADKPYAGRALFALSFAESSFFPIPPDPLLMAMGASKPKRAIWYATITSVASVLGGIFGFAIGYYLMGTEADPSLGIWLLNIYDPLVENAAGVMERHTWVKIEDWFAEFGLVALLIAAITPIPFKVFTIASGAMAAIGLFPFIGACIVGRSFRFFLEGVLLRYFGKPIVDWMDKWFDLAAIAFAVILVGGFVLLKYI
jgi:membrane protein YqaA with SNARE-associated domain